MKILAITDGGNWCLDKLTQVVVQGNPQHEWTVLPVHPKEVMMRIPDVREAMEKADLVWHQYFRTAAQLHEVMPDLFRRVPQILTQHNQRDKVFEHDYSWADFIVCHTEAMKKKLIDHNYGRVCVIPHGIDLDFFSYDANSLDGHDFVVGFVGRTKPWKRFAVIQRTCDRLQVPMVGMGRRDDAYARDIVWDNIAWFENIADELRAQVYQRMSVFVNFSEDGYEEGPMPLLEAMASGIPVITTPTGFAADHIKDGENGIVVQTEEDLEHAINMLKGDRKLANKLRENAWNTIKGFSEPKMAIQYERLFNQVKWPSEQLASVVIPTYQRKEELAQVIDGVAEQTYNAIEVVVADDDPAMSAFEVVEAARIKYPSLAIKYVATHCHGYGLAQARNLGAIEAQGHYLVFLDDRYLLEPSAIQNIIFGLESAKRKAWVFGDKGSQKKTFVENFSCIRRQDFIDMGMFCERITAYGGMSQECRTRALHQGFELKYIAEAKASTIIQTRRMYQRRSDIWKMKQLLHRMGLAK